MEIMKLKHPVPICATVSRSTGEIRIDWADDLDTQIKFGKIMNQIDRRMRIEAMTGETAPGTGEDAFSRRGDRT